MNELCNYITIGVQLQSQSNLFAIKSSIKYNKSDELRDAYNMRVINEENVTKKAINNNNNTTV